MNVLGFLLLLLSWAAGPGRAAARPRPVPDRLVVLTFDDAALSHATYVAPLLKKYGFGATFFVCEFREPPFADKSKYMSWAQIGELHRLGFEVGSHTLTHRHVNKLSESELAAELDSVESRCRAQRIPRPVTFAYPGYDTAPRALPVLAGKGYRLARAGGDRPYDPATDNPLLIPSFTTLATNRQQILDALALAKDGRIVVLTIHGVPDYAHDWVTTPPALFEEYLRYLHEHRYHVVALRDVARYVAVKQPQPALPAPQ
ncbi:polysaccharide deacetylase family protein [Hymenobacter sp. HMF4947]|uniref:Polysaccharide deacetylase family protein n=1 Tax=Hymenobacter ginkgonis TaxID=2682976 RepID=A0A7K1TJT6_9BACT|nr:polysaccharide deacetylase family protein [Hymenobacter ginkgonis]MVN78667.1 polysaccharide deacetylase family protein [Hymenobacter ginkgonis]